MGPVLSSVPVLELELEIIRFVKNEKIGSSKMTLPINETKATNG